MVFDFESQILALCLFTKCNSFLWLCWFLANNKSYFVFLSWKLDNPYYRLYWTLTTLAKLNPNLNLRLQDFLNLLTHLGTSVAWKQKWTEAKWISIFEFVQELNIFHISAEQFYDRNKQELVKTGEKIYTHYVL